MTYLKNLRQTTTLGAAGAAMGNIRVDDFLNAFHSAVAVGAAANTQITLTCSGTSHLKVGDKILYAWAKDVSAATDTVSTDITNLISIVDMDKIKVTVSTVAQSLEIAFVSLV